MGTTVIVGIVLVDIVVVCGSSSGTVFIVVVPVRCVSLALCEASWGQKQNLGEIGRTPTDTGLRVLRDKIRMMLPNPFHMLRILTIGFPAF